jgi:hypothetical protein
MLFGDQTRQLVGSGTPDLTGCDGWWFMGKQGNSGLGFGKSDKFFKRATPRFVKLWECVGQGRNKRFAGREWSRSPSRDCSLGLVLIWLT